MPPTQCDCHMQYGDARYSGKVKRKWGDPVIIGTLKGWSGTGHQKLMALGLCTTREVGVGGEWAPIVKSYTSPKPGTGGTGPAAVHKIKKKEDHIDGNGQPV
ncbi:hypothetical protein Tco_1430227 [Tanacetum coccineum]